MTNKELIEELKKLPEDMEVMYEDNEYGEQDINQIEIKTYGKWTGLNRVETKYISLA